MAQTPFHVNLTSKLFPFNLDEMSQTVLIGNGVSGEQNRVLLGGFDGEEPVQQYGICQAYYMQNVLPIARGYSSIHFQRKLLSHGLSADVKLTDAFAISNSVNEVALFGPTATQNLIYDADTGGWVDSGGFAQGSRARAQVSKLKGTSYIFFPEIGVSTYNFDTQSLEQQDVPALSMPAIKFMVAAGPYLIASDGITVYWSSYLDPLDFYPAQSTGAGSTKILELKGNMVAIVSLGTGFVIYTNSNAIHAQATNNVNNPWVFKQIDGAVGVSSSKHICNDSVTGRHVVWTSFGFQEITPRGAEFIFPELSEGIARGYLPVIGPAGRPEIGTFDSLDVRLNSVSARYICISVRSNLDALQEFQFKTCFVFDGLLRRFGRIDIPHIDVLEFSAPEFYRSDTYAELATLYPTYDDLADLFYLDLGAIPEAKSSIPNENFGFIQQDGTLFTACFANSAQAVDNDDLDAAVDAPRIYLGKFKVTRNAGVTSEQIRVNHLHEDCILYAHNHDVNGKFIGSKEITHVRENMPGHLFGRHTGDSVSLEIRGRFTLTDLTIYFSPAGRKNLPRQMPTTYYVVNGTDNVLLDGVQVTSGP